MRPRDLEALELPKVLDAVAARARSAPARERVARMVPGAEPAEVAAELERVDALRRLLADGAAPPVGDLPDIRAALAVAAHDGATLGGQALGDIASTLDAARAVSAFFRSHRCAQLQPIARRIHPLRALSEALRGALEEDGKLRDLASEELATLRARIRHLQEEIESRLRQLLRRPDVAAVSADDFVTVRNGRFVIPVRLNFAQGLEGVVQDRSASGETLYVEPLFAVELNNRLIIARREEEAEERRILRGLTELVRAEFAALEETFEALVALDVLAAKAAFALSYGCVRPQVGCPDIALEAARHPLLLLAKRAVTPVDLVVAADRRGLVITGPNTGGKTVALKTLGLLALMAQSGLLIPAAAGSRLPVFRGVYADLSDEQSIERDLSTFSSHVENMVQVLGDLQLPALVLLDEPGVGTDPADGSALAIGLLSVLKDRGVHVAATSHYSAVKLFALRDPDLEVAAVDFDARSLTPLYRLVYHTLGPSLALPLGRRLGLPAEVMAAAEDALSPETREVQEALARLEEMRRGYEEAAARARAEAEAVSAERRQLEALREELAGQKRRRWGEELREARAFLERLRTEGRELLAHLERGGERAADLDQFVRERREDIAAREAAISEPRGGEEAPLHVGDLVEVVGRGIRGELAYLEGDRARILRGGLRFEVSAAQLRRVGKMPAQTLSVRAPDGEDAPAELVLVGLRAREAVDRLASFLDRAVLARRSSVRIIHGTGTGALRRTVHEYLARSPYCQRFREGDMIEGGRGVTVVELE